MVWTQYLVKILLFAIVVSLLVGTLYSLFYEGYLGKVNQEDLNNIFDYLFYFLNSAIVYAVFICKAVMIPQGAILLYLGFITFIFAFNLALYVYIFLHAVYLWVIQRT